MSSNEKDESASTLVGQKLQSVEEVYIYKIPPLKTSGGHRYVAKNNLLAAILIVIARLDREFEQSLTYNIFYLLNE